MTIFLLGKNHHQSTTSMHSKVTLTHIKIKQIIELQGRSTSLHTVDCITSVDAIKWHRFAVSETLLLWSFENLIFELLGKLPCVGEQLVRTLCVPACDFVAVHRCLHPLAHPGLRSLVACKRRCAVRVQYDKPDVQLQSVDNGGKAKGSKDSVQIELISRLSAAGLCS